MVSSYTLDLFNDPFFIGFNRELNRFNHVHNTATRQSYPPYDLIKVDEDTYKLSVAVAGFTKDDVKVTVEDGTLVVKGEITTETEGEAILKGEFRINLLLTKLLTLSFIPMWPVLCTYFLLGN